jgi:hypothetical protein
MGCAHQLDLLHANDKPFYVDKEKDRANKTAKHVLIE